MGMGRKGEQDLLSILPHKPGRATALVATLFALFLPAVAGACILDAYPDGSDPPSTYVFPNWQKFNTTVFDLVYGDCVTMCVGWCAGDITAVTLVNYGTANGTSDITGVYFCVDCTTACTAPAYTMTYAGDWDNGQGVSRPAWTWAGAILIGNDPCDPPGAGSKGCTVTCAGRMRVFIDIGPCPTEQATIAMGPNYYDDGVAVWVPGITDQYNYQAPWYESQDSNPDTIVWSFKTVDMEQAAPGDTLNYTIFYGRPGQGTHTSIEVWDTLPSYTHLVMSSAVPACDPGFDPDPGPPQRLRWTVPGASTTGGPTSSISYKVTVDWGNLESFEPGSGDNACPEGQRLSNRAQIFWKGGTPCAIPTSVTGAAETVVKRFLFWKLADNDLLFAPAYGQPDDEITYEIFLKSMSATKTWWKVMIWDTVPPEIDNWGVGYGFEDPCIGWTMTPTGCSAATPGYRIVAGKTILTWTLDMAPGQTLMLHWKGKVRPTCADGNQAVNRISLLSLGWPGVMGGSGHSTRPANFTHLAKIALRTTYYSYTSYSASQDAASKSQARWLIPFFPLNRQTNFELRKLEYTANAGIAATGGKSASINTLVGSCTGGYADGGFSMAGCKAERSPSLYMPLIDHLGWMLLLYKVTSNSPVLWQTMSQVWCGCHDAHTFAPSTSLSYRGFMHYTGMRPDETCLACAGHGERVAIINTSMSPTDSFDATASTTIHIFKWNTTQLSWDYVKSGDVAGESIWVPLEGTYAVAANTMQYLRVISSDTQILTYVGLHTFGNPAISGAYDNNGMLGVNRENGNLVNSSVPANVYVMCRHNSTPNMIIGSTDVAAGGTYNLWKYKPNATMAPANFPVTLAGSSGTWAQVSKADTCGPGLTGPTHVYGQGGNDASTVSGVPYLTGWKVEVTAGKIQVEGGANIFNGCAGACNMHDSTGLQAGTSFWFHEGVTSGCGDMNSTNRAMYICVFSPKANIPVGLNSGGPGGSGLVTATYTTDGPDQCVAFMGLTNPGNASWIAYRVCDRTGASSLIAQYQMSSGTEKAFTAPFVRTGVHYNLLAPPTVFVGESYWFTLAVIDSDGDTKTDYVGIASFTSTDSTAKIGAAGMDTYNYTFILGDKGVKVFVNVTMTKLGLQTLVAQDTMDGSITGITTLMVVGADVKFFKEPALTVGASGDTVNFKICWSNYSSASAISFVVTDAVPVGTTYVPQIASNHICGTTKAITYDFAYSTSSGSAAPTSGWVNTTGTPPSNTYWLRWTIRSIDIDTTGCACFRVKVN
jgi:uncharacterized repeat protein (TIGR01451 family)